MNAVQPIADAAVNLLLFCAGGAASDMTDRTTDYRKGRDGWRGETVLPLGFAIEGKPAELTLNTYKNTSGPGIVTYAGVRSRDGGFTTTRIFRDYHTRCRVNSAVRCTEKAVKAEHEYWLGNLDQGANILALAIEHHRALGDLEGNKP